MAFATPAAAASTSASSKTITGDLPPSSSDTRFRLPADAFTISCPTSVLPVNATLSTPACEASAAPASPKPVTTFTTPSGKPTSHTSCASRSAVSGVCSAGLSTTRVAAGERGAELPGRHQQREVPGDDLTDHADRLAQRVVEEAGAVGPVDRDRLALDLGRPARVVAEVVDGERHVGGARHRERLAVVEALELRELLGERFDAIGELPEQAPALGRIHAPPGARVECAPRGGDGALDVGGAALRDLRDRALLRRILDGEAAAVGRGREASIDQQAVLLGEEGLHGGQGRRNRGSAGGRHGVDLTVSGGCPIMPWRGRGVKPRAAPALPRRAPRRPRDRRRRRTRRQPLIG